MKSLTSTLIILFSCIQMIITENDKIVDSCFPARADGQIVKPNVVFIMADDAGWNDFSFHGSPQIPTPNIDALAFSGMVLNSYYGSPLCSPTRGAVMTGKHPIHLKLQHYVLLGASPFGLPLEEKTLPQYLKELGYDTHLVGKWHLGHSKKEYLPTYRGFDSHYGYWLSVQDYWTHECNDNRANFSWGYDFHNDVKHNLSNHYEAMGIYDTDLFTNEAVRLIQAHDPTNPMFLMVNHIAPHSAHNYDPLQAPIKNIEKFNSTIQDYNRRVYAAMVDKLDESVGLIVQALADKRLLNNTIIVFASDNGGAPEGYDFNYGSNWPLRGAKNTLWEGGTRLAALLWSPFTQNRVSNDVFHAQDWLPTIYEAAGCSPKHLESQIDGKSIWKSFTKGFPSPRQTMLYNIDDIYNNSAIRHKEWKLIQGKVSSPDLGGLNWDSWYGPSGRSEGHSVGSLIPSIVNSLAGKALPALGFLPNASKIAKLQNYAQISCKEWPQKNECNPLLHPCLFNLLDDPCEMNNIADKYPQIVTELLEYIAALNATALTPYPREYDQMANPTFYNDTWISWLDKEEQGKGSAARHNCIHPIILLCFVNFVLILVELRI